MYNPWAVNQTKHNLLYSFDEEYRKKYDFMQGEKKRFVEQDIKGYFTGWRGLMLLLGLIFNVVISKQIGVFVYVSIHALMILLRYCLWRASVGEYYNSIKEYL